MRRLVRPIAFVGVLALATVLSMGQTRIYRGWVAPIWQATTGFLAGDGTASAPSYSFPTDTLLGMFKGGWNIAESASSVSASITANGSNVVFQAGGGSYPFYLTSNTAAMGSGVSLGWASTATAYGAGLDTLLCRGAAAVIGVGGCTSSFPALKRSNQSIQFRLADDSGDAAIQVASAVATGSSGFSVSASSSYGLSNKIIVNTAPTVASGFGTSPAIVANGTAAFTINVGTGGVATGGVFTMPAATTGWACRVENLTGNAANRANQRTLQTATTTTSVTIQNQTISTGAALAWTASDIVQLMCLAY